MGRKDMKEAIDKQGTQKHETRGTRKTREQLMPKKRTQKTKHVKHENTQSKSQVRHEGMQWARNVRHGST